MKKRVITFLVLVSIAVASVCAFAEEELYDLPSGNIDIVDLARRVSAITKKPILHGKDFVGTAHLVISRKVTAQEAYDILISVLSDAGFSIIEKGKICKIVKKGSEIDPNLVFMGNEPVGPSDKRITVFIELAHVSSAEVAAALQSLTSEEGKLIASPAGNKLIVVDNAANVDRIRKAAADLDQEGAKMRMEIFHLKRADALIVSEMLKELFPKVGRYRSSKFGQALVAVPDLRTNSVIVRAPDDEVKIARNLCKAIDDQNNKAGITVQSLKSSDAQELSTLFESLK